MAPLQILHCYTWKRERVVAQLNIKSAILCFLFGNKNNSVSDAQNNLIKILFITVQMWVSRAYSEQVICLLPFIMIKQESLCLPLRDWEVKIFQCIAKLSWRPLLCLLPVSCWIFSWPILWPWIWKLYVPPKRQLTFNGLHDAIPQKK
jgi:hypothetical protein